MNVVTKTLPYTALKVGHIVHFHGARFEITSTKTYPQEAYHITRYGVISDTMSAIGKWIDGTTVTGYFGPGKDWHFQGNASAIAEVEVPCPCKILPE